MRKLTVSTLRRQWGAMHRNREACVPFIRMSGNWLAEAGFTPGQQVSVTIADRTLNITPTETRPQ
jgi:hypothetical protein